jgi:hypothetical protein
MRNWIPPTTTPKPICKRNGKLWSTLRREHACSKAAFGHLALNDNTSGNYNTAVGERAR